MRINHANLTRTIIYGTAATKIEGTAGEATHRWRVFIRGYKNTDLSYFIRSVTFKTHETFANPTRIVDSPPFEIEECGWGEFTIQGKIYFTDVHEKPVGFLISLKLHHDPTNHIIGDIEYDPAAIHNERMDTIVFESPTEATYKLIKSHPEPIMDPPLLDEINDEKRRIELAIDAIIEKLENEHPK
ncbi:YEATS domain-containing protein 4 [Nematocida homosporus]|uniref:YEATS domain-containing protein 4 n=1 Tax=Nematocida homosporus TaxID=1912981 RepID=UPI0022202A22|nr:YEATS domain-containing protein 4 [Nematocida homosporus]KAI5186313.1 YEATS domain-containing protein 4 [Nematocida homosporus]